MPEPYDLEDALVRARRGDEAAFSMLYRALQPGLVRYLAVAASGGHRGGVADDLAAETWAGVVAGLGTFTGDLGAFRAWVFTIARHRAVDAGRRRSRRPEVLVGEDLEPEGRDPGADVAVEERISTQAALALVARLPAAQAEVVALRFVAGLDVAAVAGLTGHSTGNVRVLTHRGLAGLRLLLDASTDEARVALVRGGLA